MVQQKLFKAIGSKIPRTIDKGTIAELGLLGGTSAAAISMYNNVERDLEYAKRNAKRNITMSTKTAGAIDTLKSLFLRKYPEFGENAIEVTKDDKTTSVTFNGPHNLGKETLHAIKTIKDDPGNHKKKALLGLTGALASFGLAAKDIISVNHDETFKALTEQMNRAPENTSVISRIAEKVPWGAIPASAYYMARNIDRPARAGVGAAATAASVKLKLDIGYRDSLARKNFNQAKPMNPEDVAKLNRASAGLTLGVGSGAYALHHFQAADDLERLRELKHDTELSNSEKAKKINAIKERHDFLTRYPVFRAAPWSERVRSVYNKFHPPVPRVTPEDYQEYFVKTINKSKDLGNPLKES